MTAATTTTPLGATTCPRWAKPVPNATSTVLLPASSDKNPTLPADAPRGLVGWVTRCFDSAKVTGPQMCATSLSEMALPGHNFGSITYVTARSQTNGNSTFSGYLPGDTVKPCTGLTVKQQALCLFDDVVGYANSARGTDMNCTTVGNRVAATARCCAGMEATCFPGWCPDDPAGNCWNAGRIPAWMLGDRPPAGGGCTSNKPEPKAFAELFCGELGPNGVPARDLDRAPFGALTAGDPTGGKLCQRLREANPDGYSRAMAEACFASSADRPIADPRPWFLDTNHRCLPWCNDEDPGTCASLLRPVCAPLPPPEDDANRSPYWATAEDERQACACMREPGWYERLRAEVLNNYDVDDRRIRDETRPGCIDPDCAAARVTDPALNGGAAKCPDMSIAECVSYGVAGDGSLVAVQINPFCLKDMGGPYTERREPPGGGGNKRKCATTSDCATGFVCDRGSCEVPCTRDADCGDPTMKCAGSICVPNPDAAGKLAPGWIVAIAVASAVVLAAVVFGVLRWLVPRLRAPPSASAPRGR